MTAPRTAPTEPAKAEDFRIAMARKALAESKAPAAYTGNEAIKQWGVLEVAVALLLDFIDEKEERP